MATSLVLSPSSTSSQPALSADIVDQIHALTLANTPTSTPTSTPITTHTNSNNNNNHNNNNTISTQSVPETPITITTTTTTTTTTTATTTIAPIKPEDLQNNPETGLYDEVEIEDMEWDDDKQIYTYPCPCGDKFTISKLDLLEGEEIARCPSCSLLIRVIYDLEEFQAQHGG